MKKTFKILLSAFLLTITFILSFSLIASAEVKKGTLANGSKWTFDTLTGTLTFSENYDFIYADDFYEKVATPYRNSVKKIITEEDAVNIKTNYDGDTYYEEPYVEFFKTDLFPNLKCYIQKLLGGFSREYDPVNYVLTLNGKGKWPDEYEFYPNIKTGDGITEVGTLDAYNGTLTIGKGLKKFGELSAKYEFEVNSANLYFAAYSGFLHSKDYTIVYGIPSTVTKWNFHPNAHTIDLRAIPYYYDLTEPIIIPWGITTLAGEESYGKGSDAHIVYPDTLKYFPESVQLVEFENSINSRNNEALRIAIGTHYTNTEKYYSYYGIKPNSLKTFQNGKTYYFDNNYKMATGWKKVNGTWYYFNDYGAAVVKIWLKSVTSYHLKL